jgi:hypothetical protein
MSASASIFATLHRLRFAKKRAAAWLLMACWLLLNSQLAIANHNCELQLSAEAPMAQHMMHMQQSAEPDQVLTTDPLCEKHCVPDSLKQDHANLTLAALPVSNELLLAAPVPQVHLSQATWQTPPIAGPPAEIVFCRFRE